MADARILLRGERDSLNFQPTSEGPARSGKGRKHPRCTRVAANAARRLRLWWSDLLA